MMKVYEWTAQHGTDLLPLLLLDRINSYVPDLPQYLTPLNINIVNQGEWRLEIQSSSSIKLSVPGTD